MDYKKHIREVPDFPKKGILFYDITTLLMKPEIFNSMIDDMAKRVSDLKIDKIAAIESRGFIFGAPLAAKLGKPFVPVRKPGKLPYKTIRYDYTLEYGKDAVEMHSDAVVSGDRVLLVDDLLATGGTIEAAANLVKKCGGSVTGFVFAIELEFLKGKQRLNDSRVESIIKY